MKAGRETSRDYAHPHRPLPVRALNALWGSVGRPWLTPVDADAWLRSAQRAERTPVIPTVLDLEPFRRLAASARDEARLNPLGRRILHERMVGAIRAHLRTWDAVEIPAIDRPVFIVGLQRTGTTFLQRLLAATPHLRGLQSWEALNPSPLRGEKGSERREAGARRAAGALAYLAPDFLAAHPVEADQPEEEVVVFEQVGMSTGFEATMRVPSYAAWLEDADQRPTYRWLEWVLETLMDLEETSRWVLKSPHHLEFLPALLEVFPDARFIWTHRDPRTTVPSFCSMVAHAHGLCSDRVDPQEIGAHWLRKTSRMVERALAFRRERPEVPFLDVRYEDLVRDPIATAERVLAFLDEPVDDATRAALATEIERSRAGRFGRHVYAAEDFGLTPDGIAEAFTDYRETVRYGMGPPILDTSPGSSR